MIVKKLVTCVFAKQFLIEPIFIFYTLSEYQEKLGNCYVKKITIEFIETEITL